MCLWCLNVTLFDLMERPYERQSFESEAADVQTAKASWGEEGSEARQGGGNTDFPTPNGGRSIETGGNVVGYGLWRGQEVCQARPWRRINVNSQLPAAENTSQMFKIWPVNPVRVFGAAVKDKPSPRRDSDTCFIQIPTGHFFWSQSKYWRHAEQQKPSDVFAA